MRGKWWMWILCSLLLMVMMVGCQERPQEETSHADLADTTGLPKAEWTNEPVIMQTIVNSGFAVEYVDGLQYSKVDNDWRLFEQWKNGELISVAPLVNLQNDLEPWVALQHDDYRFVETQNNPGYMVDDQYIYWLEAPASYNAAADRWYLYMRAVSRDGAQGAPILVAEGDYQKVNDDDEGSGLPQDWAGCNGNVLWSQFDNGSMVVALYRGTQSSTEILSMFSTNDAGRAEVALNKDLAVWTEIADDGKERVCALKRCALENDEVTDISLGRCPADPVICGEYLIVQDILEENQDGDVATNQLLVYHLTQESWAYRIGADLPVLPEGMIFEQPMIIDDIHIALAASGASALYQLPAVDLTNGKIYALEKEPETALYFCPRDYAVENLERGADVVRNIQPLNQDGSNSVLKWTAYENGMDTEEIICSANFRWRASS